MLQFLGAIGDLRAALDGDEPLIHVTGQAGAGKSEHLRAICRERHIPLCGLEHVRTCGDVCSAVLRELEIPAAHVPGGIPPEDAVAAILRQRGALILALDDVERFDEWFLDLIQMWLRRAPQLRIVIATRFRPPGGIRTRIIEVKALGLQGDPSEAARFFRSVAQASGIEGELDDSAEIRAIIERIVHLLGGLPLAIKQVVGQLRLFPLAGLAERLSRQPLRYVMNDAIGKTWELLSTPERDLLCKLAIFHDAVSTEAIESLTDDKTWNQVIAKGLLRSIDASQERRFVFDPPMLRDFVLEQLSKPEAKEVQARCHAQHAQWFLTMGRQHALRAIGSDDDSAAVRRAAERWLADAQRELLVIKERSENARPVDVQRLQAAVFCLSPLQRMRLSEEETFHQLDHAVKAGDAAIEQTEPFIRGELRRLLGRSRRYRDPKLGDCFEVLASALQDAEASGDELLIARVHTALTEACSLAQDLDRAVSHCERALAIYRQRRIHGWIGIALCQRGRIHADRFEAEEARACWQESLRELAIIGDHFFECLVHGHLASLALEQLDIAAALGEAERASELAAVLGLARDEAVARGYAVLCRHHGSSPRDEVIADYDGLVERFESLGDHRFAAYYRYYRALASLEKGDLERAERDLTLVERADEPRYRGMVKSALAALITRKGGRAEPLLTEARTALAAPDLEPLRALLDLPAAALALAERRVEDARVIHRRLSGIQNDEIRLASRVLGTWLTEARAWRIAGSGRWFCPPGDQRQSVSQLLACLLGSLARARRDDTEPVTQDQLCRAAWGDEMDRGIKLNQRLGQGILELRKLLANHGGKALIETVRGVGYRLALDPPIVIDDERSGSGDSGD